MPQRPPHACVPGCAELVPAGTRRCPKHTVAEYARQDARRGSSAARGYSSPWQRLRLFVLHREPLCRMCKAAGRTTPANEVDHIDGDSRNNDPSNLRPLCKPCHSRRTMRDQVPR